MSSKNNKQIYEEIPFQALVEQSLVGIYLIQDGVMIYCNEAFAGATGHTPEQVIGHPISEFVEAESLQIVMDQIEKRIEAGMGSTSRYFNQARHIDGHIIDLEVHGSSIMVDGRPAVAGVAVNMTQQLSYERELKQSHSQLQTLSRYINKLRETRRREMARDIHDVLGGLLTSIKMGAMRLLSKSDSTESVEIAEDIIQLSQESIDFARSTSEQLYPATLNYFGLGPTLENLLKQTKARHQLDYSVTSTENVPKLSNELSLMLYRTVQEALTNTLKYADASLFEVTISADTTSLKLSIRDNGKGIEGNQKREGGMGLLFMRERASEFNGTIHVESDSDGTLIELTIPFTTLERAVSDNE